MSFHEFQRYNFAMKLFHNYIYLATSALFIAVTIIACSSSSIIKESSTSNIISPTINTSTQAFPQLITTSTQQTPSATGIQITPTLEVTITIQSEASLTGITSEQTATRQSYGYAQVELKNRSIVPLYLSVTGPIQAAYYLNPVGSQKINIPAGVYQFTAILSGHQSAYGQKTLLPGISYWEFFDNPSIVSSPTTIWATPVY